MRLGFELQVAFFGVVAVVTLEGALDIDGVRIVAFDQIAVVAIHRTHEIGEGGQTDFRATSAESRRSFVRGLARDR